MNMYEPSPVNSLQFTLIHDTMSAYLTYCKGGYSVSYGRLLNSRGGSTKAQATSRHGGTALEREEAAGLQSSRFVAYQSERATGMDGKAEQQREVTTLAISPVAPRLTPGLFRAQAAILCVALPVCHFRMRGQVVSTIDSHALYR
jgi:hypothetical protein